MAGYPTHEREHKTHSSSKPESKSGTTLQEASNDLQKAALSVQKAAAAYIEAMQGKTKQRSRWSFFTPSPREICLGAAQQLNAAVTSFSSAMTIATTILKSNSTTYTKEQLQELTEVVNSYTIMAKKALNTVTERPYSEDKYRPDPKSHYDHPLYGPLVDLARTVATAESLKRPSPSHIQRAIEDTEKQFTEKLAINPSKLEKVFLDKSIKILEKTAFNLINTLSGYTPTEAPTTITTATKKPTEYGTFDDDLESTEEPIEEPTAAVLGDQTSFQLSSVVRKLYIF